MDNDNDIDWCCLDLDAEATLLTFCEYSTAQRTFEDGPTAGGPMPRSSDLLSGVFSFNPSESADAEQHSQLGKETPLQFRFGLQLQSSCPTFQHSTADSADSAFLKVGTEPLSKWEYGGDNEFDSVLSQGPSHAPTSHEQDSTGSYDSGSWLATPRSSSRRSLESAPSSRDAGRILTPMSSSDGTSSALTDFAKPSRFNNISHDVNAPQVRHHAKTIAPKPTSYPVSVHQTATGGDSPPLRSATSPGFPLHQSSLCAKQRAVPVLGKRKRPDAAAQQKTRQVRAVGACIRCRMLNIKCDEYMPCRSCGEAETTAKVQWTPCYRSGFNSVIAFRAGNARAGVPYYAAIKKGGKWSSKLNWDGAEIAVKSASLSYPFKDPAQLANYQKLIISCRRFIPGREHVLSEPWRTPSGELRTLISEPYGCEETEENLESLQSYVDGYQGDFLLELKGSLQDELYRYHLEAAKEYATDHDTSAVFHVLRIQAMSYFARKRMVCAKSDGLHQSLDDDDCRNVAIECNVPIPAHLDAQIDHMTIQCMHRQMEKVSKRLSNILFKKKNNENWYEIYLSMFLLLCTLETVHDRQTDIQRRFQKQNDQHAQSVMLTSDKMLGQWVHSAKTLLYHWRNVVKGQVVFDTLWGEVEQRRLRYDYHLNSSALQTMTAVNRAVSARAEELVEAGRVQLDNSDAKPLVWLSRLWIGDLTDLDIQVTN